MLKKSEGEQFYISKKTENTCQLLDEIQLHLTGLSKTPVD